MTEQAIALALLLAFGSKAPTPAPPADALGVAMQQALADRYQFRLRNVCDMLLMDLVSDESHVSKDLRGPMAMVCVYSSQPDFDWANAQRLMASVGVPSATPSAPLLAPNAVPHPPE